MIRVLKTDSFSFPLLLIIFTVAGVFGVTVGMEMQDDSMSFCPLMAGQSVICQMNATEHIAQWQQAFVGMETKIGFLALVIFLIAALSGVFAKFYQFVKLTRLAVQLFAYCRTRIGELFDPFFIAFSRGILKPKIYEPVLAYVWHESILLRMNQRYEHKIYSWNYNCNNSSLGSYLLEPERQNQ